MKTYCIIYIIYLISAFQNNYVASLCGCKEARSCYKDMVDTLQDRDEEACVEDASIGVSTLQNKDKYDVCIFPILSKDKAINDDNLGVVINIVMIYLKAVKQFCPDYVSVVEDSLTYEGRHLYEVTLNQPLADPKKEEEKPVIFVDAGQQAGTDSVGLALFIIEQLVACEEYGDMIAKAKWVILPSTNPDGMEYGRYNRVQWKKNVRPSEDGLSYGVDISRNFDIQWNSCPTMNSGFSPDFPGLCASSENETIFIKNSISHHKNHIKLYLSIRRDGHAILFPHGYTKKHVANSGNLVKVAASVAAKVNQKAGGVQVFANESIYEGSGKAVCGHSVDYAYSLGVPLAYEMRVFIGYNNRIIGKFQQLPRSYDMSLRLGYFSGIRELFNQVTSDKRFGTLF